MTSRAQSPRSSLPCAWILIIGLLALIAVLLAYWVWQRPAPNRNALSIDLSSTSCHNTS